MGLAPVAMAGAFIGGFAEISNLSLIPNVALAAGLSPDAALWLLSTMTAGGVALQFPIGWLSDKVSRFTVTIALAIAFIVLALALPMALTTPLAAIVVAFLIGGVILGFYTVGLAIIGERVGANDLAAANAAFLVDVSSRRDRGPVCRRYRDDNVAGHRLRRDGRDADGGIGDRPVGARTQRPATRPSLTVFRHLDRG